MSTLPKQLQAIGDVPGWHRVAVVCEAGEYRLHATAAVGAGEVVFEIDGVISREPSRHSLQVGVDEHLVIDAGDPVEARFDGHCWRYLNHSCEPNLVVRHRTLIATRPILANDQLTFNYNTTEFDMAEPFACGCGAPTCLGLIRGYRHLSTEHRAHLRPLLAEHLKRLAIEDDE